MNSDLNKIKDIIDFRKELHQHPELSGNEKKTAHRLKKFIHPFNPDKIIENIGGHGVIAVFKGETKLKGGIYFLLLPQNKVFDFLVDKHQNFSIILG